MGWKITLWYRWAVRRTKFLKQGPGCSFRVFPEGCLVWGPAKPTNESVSLFLKCTALKSCHKMLQSSPAPQDKVAESWWLPYLWCHPMEMGCFGSDCGSTPGFCPFFVLQRFGFFFFSIHPTSTDMLKWPVQLMALLVSVLSNFMAHSSSSLNYSNSRIKKKSLPIGAFATLFVALYCNTVCIAFDSNANLKIFSPICISKCPKSCLLNFPFFTSWASYFILLFTVFSAIIQLLTVQSAAKKTPKPQTLREDKKLNFCSAKVLKDVVPHLELLQDLRAKYLWTSASFIYNVLSLGPVLEWSHPPGMQNPSLEAQYG